MTPAATLAAYAAGLAVAFGAAVGVGGIVGPVGTAATADPMAGMDMGPAASGDTDGPAAAAQGLPAGGLAVSQDGYSLQLARTVQTPGVAGRLQFAVAGPDGERVTDFTPTHDRELHLIVVRRDTTSFQHLHPERDARGAWSVPLTLPSAGSYKVIADFTPAGREDPLALAAELTAPGTSAPEPLPPQAPSVEVDGGYDVRVDGDLTAGRSSDLTITVTRDGVPVTDLEPYLGAYGHLVALRTGDLAYLHVHPADGTETPGPEIPFTADVPTTGTYRLFLQFQHDGAVRTAPFTVTAQEAS